MPCDTWGNWQLASEPSNASSWGGSQQESEPELPGVQTRADASNLLWLEGVTEQYVVLFYFIQNGAVIASASKILTY